MHTDSGMTGISLSGYMPYMTVASLEMSDEPDIVHPHRLDALSYKHFGRQLNNGLTLHTHLLTGTAAKVDKKTKKQK